MPYLETPRSRGTMSHGNGDHAIPAPLEQRRHEAVHVVEIGQVEEGRARTLPPEEVVDFLDQLSSTCSTG